MNKSATPRHKLGNEYSQPSPAGIQPAASSECAEAFGFCPEISINHLIDIVADEYPMLHKYVGDIAFAKMGKLFINTYLSQNANARWFSNHLADFLQTYEPFIYNPEIQEFAALELAMKNAFEAPNVKSLMTADRVAPDEYVRSTMPLAIHPSATRLVFSQNTTSLWSAMKCDGKPPKPHRLETQQQILVWRQGASSRFRMLGDEEAAAFDISGKGATFAQLCQVIARFEEPQLALQRATSYLRGWIEAELLLALPVSPAKPEK